jgi:ABC-type nitrate/sulfonate/bicarbonate transport system ATPase subunit
MPPIDNLSPPRNELITFKDVHFSFGTREIFRSLDFELRPKEIVVLIGGSGSGKTTFLRLAAGLLKPDLGQIQLSSQVQGWGYVSQNSGLVPWLDVMQNLRVFLKNSSETFEKCTELLDRFGLSSYEALYPHDLSGGMKQKVSLIRAFASNPEIVLMDEPFSHLDMALKSELYLFVRELWQTTGAAVILVTHDIDEALLLAHRILICSAQEKNLSASPSLPILADTIVELRTNPSYPGEYSALFKVLIDEYSKQNCNRVH